MAYGLRAIHNKGYIPYGNGRDWFFIGDLSYSSGRKTPRQEDRYKIERMVGPACNRPRGQPAEMTYGPYFGTTKWKKGSYKNRICQSTGALPNPAASLSSDTRVEAIHKRWKTAHEAPTNIESSCADVWRKQVVVPRDIKHAAENVPDQAVDIRPLVTRGHCTVIQTAQHHQPAAPPAAQRFAQPTLTSASLGQFQYVDDSKAVMKDKYKTFSSGMSHTSRFDFMER